MISGEGQHHGPVRGPDRPPHDRRRTQQKTQIHAHSHDPDLLVCRGADAARQIPLPPRRPVGSRERQPPKPTVSVRVRRREFSRGGGGRKKRRGISRPRSRRETRGFLSGAVPEIQTALRPDFQKRPRVRSVKPRVSVRRSARDPDRPCRGLLFRPSVQTALLVFVRRSDHDSDHPVGVSCGTIAHPGGTAAGQPSTGRDSWEGAMVRVVVTVPTGSIDFIHENPACR